MVRALLALLLASAFAGCALPEPTPAPPVAEEARVVALSTPACALIRVPFELRLVVENPGAAAGRADVAVYAQQYGYVAREAVDVAAGESRDVTLTGAIDIAGWWTLTAQAPFVKAEQVDMRVVDPRAAGSPAC